MFESLSLSDLSTLIGILVPLGSAAGALLKALTSHRRNPFKATLSAYQISNENKAGSVGLHSEEFLVELSVRKLAKSQQELEFVVTISDGLFDLSPEHKIFPVHAMFIPDDGSDIVVMGCESLADKYHVNHSSLSNKAVLGEDEAQNIAFGVVGHTFPTRPPVLRVYSCFSVFGIPFRNILSVQELPVLAHQDANIKANPPVNPPR